MFDHGDVFWSMSDGNQPTVWLYIEYGDVFKSVFYFSDMFGNLLYFGAVLEIKCNRWCLLTTGFYIGDVVRIMFYFSDVLVNASDVKKQPVWNMMMLTTCNQF
jgi:hypothetical protein